MGYAWSSWARTSARAYVACVGNSATEIEAEPFDVEILVGVTFIGAIVALGVAYYFLR
jgi:hypothetical protein